MDNLLKINTRYGSFSASQYFEPTNNASDLQKRLKSLASDLNRQLVTNEVSNGNLTMRMVTTTGEQFTHSVSSFECGTLPLLEIAVAFLFNQCNLTEAQQVHHIQLSSGNLVYKAYSDFYSDSAQKELLTNIDRLSKKYGKIVALQADNFYKYELSKYVAGF